MGNRGRRSRGCFMCLNRRIKCDEVKPECGQCQKTNRKCPGYKDDANPKFRDETKAIKKKAHRTARTRTLTYASVSGGLAVQAPNRRKVEVQSRRDCPQWDSSIRSTFFLDSSLNSTTGISPASIPQLLPVPIGQRASCFFLSNFVLTPDQGSSRGYLDFLIPMLEVDNPTSHLSLAFSAVALAAFANSPNGKPVLPQAMGQYAKALQQINLIIHVPNLALLDSTVAAVFLLGIFESLISPRFSAMISHIDGAVALLKLRGKKHLRTRVSHQIFGAIRAQMTVNCMVRSKAPEVGVSWWILETEDRVVEVAANLNLRVTELQEDCSRIIPSAPRTPDSFEKILMLMNRAEALEQEFVNWSNSVPEMWQYRPMAWAKRLRDENLATANAYPGKVDMYGDIYIANVWNLCRASRLFISGVILRCTAWLHAPVNYRVTPEYAKASQLGAELIGDIVASVPYFCGWRRKCDTEPFDIVDFASEDDCSTSTRGLSGMFLVWPLVAATSSDFATDSQRKWLKGRLQVIPKRMGFNQVGQFSEIRTRLPSMLVQKDAMDFSLQPVAALPVLLTSMTTKTGGSFHELGTPVSLETKEYVTI